MNQYDVNRRQRANQKHAIIQLRIDAPLLAFYQTLLIVLVVFLLKVLYRYIPSSLHEFTTMTTTDKAWLLAAVVSVTLVIRESLKILPVCFRAVRTVWKTRHII